MLEIASGIILAYCLMPLLFLAACVIVLVSVVILEKVIGWFR
jgi:hypothetical protein